jgi:nucleotide-binding universal stress UspA family protein
MKKILVPCDFSEPAQQAYKFALSLAEASDGEVYVMHAMDMPLMYESAFGLQPYVLDSRLEQELEEKAKSNFLKLQSLMGKGTENVSFHIIHGPVALSIRDFIKEKNIDLVVMGTRGAGGLKEYLVGSNTEKIVRTSRVPVFAIRKAPDIKEIKSIVLPTTLRMDHPEFIEKVKALQRFFHAKLHVLYINTPVDFRTDRDIQPHLQEFAKRFKLTDYTLNMRNDAYETDGIISFAGEIKADMIAMATHGRRGVLHLLTGSVTEDVVNHVDCLMWTWSLKGESKETSKAFTYEEDFSSY